MKRKKRMIAPRLMSGERREGIGHCLPSDIKQCLQDIAKSEKQSLSWVLEQVVIEYFELQCPEYKGRK